MSPSPSDVIDLRSDTVTRPSEAMRAAMAAAPVGDDQFGEDPTVNLLQARVAALLATRRRSWCPPARWPTRSPLAVLSRRLGLPPGSGEAISLIRGGAKAHQDNRGKRERFFPFARHDHVCPGGLGDNLNSQTLS
jgi:hypothetical protein